MFRRYRGIQKERRRYTIDHSLDEVADIPALKEELDNLEYEQYVQLCIENSKKPHTCIKNVSVQNFKSLRDIDNLEMKPMGIHSFNTSTNQEIIRVSLSDSNTNSISVNIADVGFGISQVFPIVLEGIRMDKGDTLILEQPEIHLHPKLQMQMADYLLAMAISGRNFVIETHSDHIINRFIRRMVEDEQLQLTDLVQIYFVTPTENGANFEPIMIDDTKGLINWPEGFFDQAADEQEMIIRAGLKKRKKKRQLIKENKS